MSHPGFFKPTRLLILIIFFLSFTLRAEAADEVKSLVCYFDASSHWREGLGRFSAEDIDPTLCTHIMYSYIGLSERTNRVYSLDPGLDLGPGEIELDPDEPNNNIGDKDMIRKTTQLRDANSDLKVLISVGGIGQRSRTFSDMVRHIANRTQFVNSAKDFVQKYELDGIDLDWRFPTQGDGGRPEDKENFLSVVKEMREGLNGLGQITGRKYLLTGTFGCKKEIVDNAYNLQELNKHLDTFHLLCFDMKVFSTESEDGQLIGHHSPLYNKSSESPKDQELNVNFGVNLFLESGVSPQKLSLGVSAYARTYEVGGSHNFYDQAFGPGPEGPFTLQPGFLSYYEICWELKENLNDWQIMYDYDYEVPYGFNSTMWLGYDNEISVQEKVDFAITKGLGGMMVQFLDLDDCRNICQGWSNCPLTAAIKDRLSHHQKESANLNISSD